VQSIVGANETLGGTDTVGVTLGNVLTVGTGGEDGTKEGAAVLLHSGLSFIHW
jgi:hypothetical protein